MQKKKRILLKVSSNPLTKEANSISREKIEEVFNLEDLKREAVSSKSSHGSGGMTSKIEAVAIGQNANIETWIVNGIEDHFITNAFENKVPFTKIK